MNITGIGKTVLLSKYICPVLGNLLLSELTGITHNIIVHIPIKFINKFAKKEYQCKAYLPMVESKAPHTIISL